MTADGWRTKIPRDRNTWLLILVLVSSFALKLHHLDHQSIKPLDEVFHAIVAQNFLSHPLTPILNDQIYLESNPADWQNAHIWLHKPPLAMWQIACFYAFFGVNTLALRLPSAILSTLAVWLTARIGRELLDSTAGLIAAALQAFNPVIMMIVHGRVFSDHIDISLLFWTELAIYFLVRLLGTQRVFDIALCGVAQGLAFLSKSYPALIVTGLAGAIWVMGNIPSLRSDNRRLSGKSVLMILAATVVTILPWTIWALIRWPHEFVSENLQMLRHATADVEGWAAPWDRLAFDYMVSIYHVYYPAILAALIMAIFRAWQDHNPRLWIVIAWALGVLIPNLLVTSKTMTATLVGWPAMWLLLGYLISQAVRGEIMALGTWLVAMLLALFLIRPTDISPSGFGYPPGSGFALIMRRHLWVIWQSVGALIGGATIAIQLWRSPTVVRTTLIAIATAAMLALTMRWWPGDSPRRYIYDAWRVTQIREDQPDFRAIGRFAQALPPQAVFMVDEQSKLENKLIQFAAQRTCYPIGGLDIEPLANSIIASGGLPYLITFRQISLPVVLDDPDSGRTIYALTPLANSAAEQASPATRR